jgi:hypothetical protein
MKIKKSKFVCEACGDSHQVWGTSRETYQMCTQCPVPCNDCAPNKGACYCAETPCGCQCHMPESKDLMGWYVAPLSKKHIAELRFKLAKCRGIIHHMLATYKDSSYYDAEEDLPTLEQLENILKETTGD